MACEIVSIKIILITFSLATIDCSRWSCAKDGKAVPVVPSQVAGTWYEIIRIPSSYAPACVEVLVPESQLNGNYTLELNYVNNVNKGWKPTRESLVFPWSEAMNGNFNLIYSDGGLNMSVNFKYLGSMRDYTVVCGYTGLATDISIIRILSRDKSVNSTIKAKLNELASRYMIPSDLTWVEQDGRCNGSERLTIYQVGLWFCFLFIRAIA